jgi:Spy/CpxP family protein refolding chaperone
MKLTRIICVSALSAGLIACNKGNGETTAATSASANVAGAAPSARIAKRRMRRLHRMGARRWSHGWFASMLFGATRQIQLTDPQKASVKKLEQQFAVPDQSGDKAFKDFNDALVEGVKAGKIDTTKLEPLYAEIDKAVQARHDRQVQALDSLHAALDPAARKALVEAVQKRQSEREAHMAEAAAKKKDWRAEFAKRRLERMTQELSLDADRQKRVQALLAQDQPSAPTDDEKAAAKKRVDDFLAAFEKDTFDAKSLDLGELPDKNAHTRMDHRVAFLNKLLPILTPEQRDKYATQLERRPAMNDRMGKHAPRRMHMKLPFDTEAQPPSSPLLPR